MAIKLQGPREEPLQAAVSDFLTLALPLDAIHHHSPGEGKRGHKAQRELKRSGHKAGFPDLLILWRDHPAILIELKPPGKSLSKVQRELSLVLARCGHLPHVCHTVDEVQAVLERYGMPLRARLLHAGAMLFAGPAEAVDRPVEAVA